MEKQTMTQLTDEHFELHTKNKAEQHERQKIKFLEDRIKVLESAIESHAKILARFQMTEANEQDFERHEKLWGDKS
jgi:TolA-binding protein